MADVSEVLELVKGSAKPFDIFLYNENDQPEDLSGATAATFAIREETDAEPILLLRTADANLDIDDANSKLVGEMTQDEADELPLGVFIAAVALKVGGLWFHSDPIKVRILAAHAPATE